VKLVGEVGNWKIVAHIAFKFYSVASGTFSTGSTQSSGVALSDRSEAVSYTPFSVQLATRRNCCKGRRDYFLPSILCQWLVLRHRTKRRRPLDLGDHLFSKCLDRFQRPLRLHPRPVHGKPHELRTKLPMVRHHLFRHLNGAADYEPLLLQLLKVHIKPFAGLAPLLIYLVHPLVSILDPLLGLSCTLCHAEIAEDEETLELPAL